MITVHTLRKMSPVKAADKDEAASIIDALQSGRMIPKWLRVA